MSAVAEGTGADPADAVSSEEDWCPPAPRVLARPAARFPRVASIEALGSASGSVVAESVDGASDTMGAGGHAGDEGAAESVADGEYIGDGGAGAPGPPAIIAPVVGAEGSKFAQYMTQSVAPSSKSFLKPAMALAEELGGAAVPLPGAPLGAQCGIGNSCPGKAAGSLEVRTQAN